MFSKSNDFALSCDPLDPWKSTAAAVFRNSMCRPWRPVRSGDLKSGGKTKSSVSGWCTGKKRKATFKGCMKPYKEWDKLSINGKSRISVVKSMKHWFLQVFFWDFWLCLRYLSCNHWWCAMPKTVIFWLENLYKCHRKPVSLVEV